MITFQIPEGEACKGCMFLDEDFLVGTAHCMLFKEKLHLSYRYGELEEINKSNLCSTISKKAQEKPMYEDNDF